MSKKDLIATQTRTTEGEFEGMWFNSLWPQKRRSEARKK